MFSLVILVISLALLAVTTLGTLYFTGSIFSGASTTATTNALFVQGQQLLYAAQTFREDNGRWPTDLDELAANQYLAGTALDGEGHAWVTPRPGVPLYLLTDVDSQVCQELNSRLQYPTTEPGVDLTRTSQCYGTDVQLGAFRVVFVRSASDINAALADPAAALLLGSPP